MLFVPKSMIQTEFLFHSNHPEQMNRKVFPDEILVDTKLQQSQRRLLSHIRFQSEKIRLPKILHMPLSPSCDTKIDGRTGLTN